MSKGYLVFAQNSSTDYVRQAIALSASLKKSGNLEPISIVTDDRVPPEYCHLFDKIIPIPWGDSAKHSQWKIENRWKLYHITPYDETVVMDSDIIVTDSLSLLWNFLNNYDLYFTTDVVNFKSEQVIDTVYRQTFIQNNLPNLYSGLHYFRKSSSADEFYQLLELIVKNYNEFYEKYTPVARQEFLSIDVSAAIAAKILDNANDITCNLYHPTQFYHLKSKLQPLPVSSNKWTSVLDCNYADTMTIGNHVVRGVVHYVEDEFLTDSMFERIVSNG